MLIADCDMFSPRSAIIQGDTIKIKEFQKTQTGDFESQIAQQVLIQFFPIFV